MTASVESLYEMFLSDPDMVATTTKSREEIALGEAKQRFIQSMNNHKALSLAKSGPVEDLFSFLRYRSVFKSEFSSHGFHPEERDEEANVTNPRQHYIQEYRKAPITHEELVQALKDEYMSLFQHGKVGGGDFPYSFDELLSDTESDPSKKRENHREKLREAIIPDSQQLLFRPGQSGETTPEPFVDDGEDEEEKTGRQKELEAQAAALLEGGDDEGGTATARESHRALRGDPATALMGAAALEPGAGADKNAMELLEERAGNNSTARSHVYDLRDNFAEVNRLQSVLDNPISTRGRKETKTQSALRGFDEIEQEYKQSIGLKPADELSSDQEKALSQIEGSRPYMERSRIEELQRLAESIQRVDTGHSDFSHATNADGSIRTHDTTENSYYSPVQQWHMFTRDGSSDNRKLQTEVKRRYDFEKHHGQHEAMSSLIKQVAEDNGITLNTPPSNIEQNEAVWHETHPEGHTKTTPVKHAGEKDPEDMGMEELKDYIITNHEDLGPEGLKHIFDMIDADTTGKYQKKEMDSLKSAITPRFLTDEQRLEREEQSRTGRPQSDAPWIGDPNQAEMSDREANRMVGDFKRHPETVRPTGATTQEEYRQQALDVRPRAVTTDEQGNILPPGAPLADEQGNPLPRRTRMETEQEAIRRGPHRVIPAGETYDPELGEKWDRAGQFRSGWSDRVPPPRVAGAEHIGSTLAGGWRAEGVDYEGENPLYPGETGLKLHSKDLTDLYLGQVPSASRRNSRGQQYTAANSGTQGGRVGFRLIMNYLVALGVPLQDLTRPNDKGKPVWSLYSMEQGMKKHGFLNDRDTLQYSRGGDPGLGVGGGGEAREGIRGQGESERSQLTQEEEEEGMNSGRYPRILPGRGPGEGTRGAQSREGGPGHPAYDKRQALFAQLDAHPDADQQAHLHRVAGRDSAGNELSLAVARQSVLHLLDGGPARGAWLEAMGQTGRQYDWDSSSGLTKDKDGNVIGKPMEGPYETWGFGNQGGDSFYSNSRLREVNSAGNFQVPEGQKRVTQPSSGFPLTKESLSDYDFTLPRDQWSANQRMLYGKFVEPLEIAKHKTQHERALLSGEPTFAHGSAGGARYFDELVAQAVKDNPNKTRGDEGNRRYISEEEVPGMPQMSPSLGVGSPATTMQPSEADLRELERLRVNRKAVFDAHPESKEAFKQQVIKEFNDAHRGLTEAGRVGGTSSIIQRRSSNLLGNQPGMQLHVGEEGPIKLHWSDIARWFQYQKHPDGTPYIRNPRVPEEYQEDYPTGMPGGSNFPYVQGSNLPRATDLPRRGEDTPPTTEDPVVPPTAPEPTGGGGAETATEALLRQRQEAARPDDAPDQPFKFAYSDQHGHIPEDQKFEVSTQGNTFGQQFSALRARLPNGRTIEDVYKNDIKPGVPAGQIPEGMTADELHKAYTDLWKQWADANPEKLSELAKATRGKTLFDRFAYSHGSGVSQARSLAEILNEKHGTPPAVDALVDRQRREAIGGANVKNLNGVEAVRRAEGRGEGVDILRKAGNQHYGNPFTYRGGTRAPEQLPSVEEATQAYDDWLHGRAFRNVNPEQRQWILDQIQNGALNNKDLLYYTSEHTDAGIDSHADVLARFVNEAKGQPQNQLGEPERPAAPAPEQPAAAPTGANPADYTNHSGGAKGGDTLWDAIGKEHGITNHNHYYQGRPTSLGNTPISQAEADEAIPHLRQAAATMGRPFSEDSSYVHLLKRNWQQVKNADGIYAVTTINKGSKGYKPTPNVADGGTGWAIHMAIHQGKPVHVFEPRDRKWYAWNSDQNSFVEEGTPTLTKNYAGIGSRELHEPGTKFPASDLSQADIDAAKGAIRAVHEKTFRAAPPPDRIDIPGQQPQQQGNVTYDEDPNARRGGRQYGGGMTGGSGGRMFGREPNIADKLHDILGHWAAVTLPGSNERIQHRSEPRLEDNMLDVLAMFHGGDMAQGQDIDEYKSQFSLGDEGDLDATDLNEMHSRIRHTRDAVKDNFVPGASKSHYLDMMEHVLEKLRKHPSYDSNHPVHGAVNAFERGYDNKPYDWDFTRRVPKHKDAPEPVADTVLPSSDRHKIDVSRARRDLHKAYSDMDGTEGNVRGITNRLGKEVYNSDGSHPAHDPNNLSDMLENIRRIHDIHINRVKEQLQKVRDLNGFEGTHTDGLANRLANPIGIEQGGDRSNYIKAGTPNHPHIETRMEAAPEAEENKRHPNYWAALEDSEIVGGYPYDMDEDITQEEYQRRNAATPPSMKRGAQSPEHWLRENVNQRKQEAEARAASPEAAEAERQRQDQARAQGEDTSRIMREAEQAKYPTLEDRMAGKRHPAYWAALKGYEGGLGAVHDKPVTREEYDELANRPEHQAHATKTLSPEGQRELLQRYGGAKEGDEPEAAAPAEQPPLDPVVVSPEVEARARAGEQPTPAEQPAADEGTGLKTLSELNTEHITHRLIREAQAQQQDPPGKTSPYHAKSKWDFRKDDGTFDDGWDRIHLSRGMKDLALDNQDDDGNPQPLIELLGGAQRGDRNPQWKWTDIGEREIAPILSAMHKFHHTSLTDNGPDFHSGPDGPTPYDDGVIHTETFENILGYWKQGLLPTSFPDKDMSDEHNKWEEYRRHSVEAAKQGNVPGPDTIIPAAEKEPDQPAEEAAQPAAADIPDGSDSPMPPEEERPAIDLSNVSKEEVTAKLRDAWSKMAATEKTLKQGELGVPSGLTDADIYDNEGNVIVTPKEGENWGITNLRKILQKQAGEAKDWHKAAVHLNYFVGAPNSYGPGSPGHPHPSRAEALRQPDRSTVDQTPHELNTALDSGTPDPTVDAPRPGERRVAEEPAVQPSGAGGGWSPPPKPSQEAMNEHSPGITVRNFGEDDTANVRGAETIEGENPYHQVDKDSGRVLINPELYDRVGNRKPVRALYDAAQKSMSTAGDAPIVPVMRPQHSSVPVIRMTGLVRTFGSPFTYPGEEYWGRDESHPGKSKRPSQMEKGKRKLIMLPDAAAAAQAYRDWLNYEDTTVRDGTGKVYYLGNMPGDKRTGDDGEPQYTVNSMQRNWITKQLSEGALSGTVDARGNVVKEPSILGYHRPEGMEGESYADVLAEIANERHVQAAIGPPWRQPPKLEIPGQQLSRLRSQLKEAWRTMDKIEGQIKDMWPSTPDVTRNPEVTDPNHPDSHSFTDMDSDVSPTTLLQTVRTHQLGKGRGHVGTERDENGKRLPLPLDAEGNPDYSSILYHQRTAVSPESGETTTEHVPWHFGDGVERHDFGIETGSLLHGQPVMDTSAFEGAHLRFKALESAVEKASQLSTELANRGETMLPSQIPHPGMAGSPEHPNKASRLKEPEEPEAPTAPDDGGPTEPPVVPPPTAADQPANGKRQAIQGLADALQHRHQNLADQEEPTAEPDTPPTGADRLETLGDQANANAQVNQAAGGPNVPPPPTGLVRHEDISSESPEDWGQTQKFEYAHSIVQRLIADGRLKNTAAENYLKALTETMAIHQIHKGVDRGFDASRSLGEFKDGSWSEDNDHQGVPFFPTLLGTLTKIERELVSHDDHDISIGELAHLGNVHGTNFSDVGTIKDGTPTTPGRVDMFHRNPNDAGMRPHPIDATLDHPHTHNPSLVSDADDVDEGHLDRLNRHKPQTPEQLQAFSGGTREDAVRDSAMQHEVQRNESYGRFGRGGERLSPEDQAHQAQPDTPPTPDELNRSWNQNLPDEERRQAESTGRRPGGGGRSGGGGGGFFPTRELKEHILAQAKKINMSEQAINDTLMFDGGWKLLHDHVRGEHIKGLSAQTKEGVADTAALHPDAVQPPLQEGDDPTQYLRKLMIHVHQLFGKGRRPDAKVRPAWANAYQTAIDAGADMERLNQENRDFPQHRDGDKVYGGEEHLRSVEQQDMRNAHQNQEFHGIMNDPEALKQAYGDPAHYPHREDIIGHFGRHVGTNYNYTDDQGRVKRKRQHEVAANEEPSLTNPLIQHNIRQYGAETAAPYVAGLRAEQVDAYRKLHGDYQYNKREKGLYGGSALEAFGQPGEFSDETLRQRKIELNKQLHPEHQTRVTTTDADGNRVTRPIEEDDYDQIANGSIPHQDMTPGILDHPLFGATHDETIDADDGTVTPGKRQLGIHVDEDWDSHWKQMGRLGDEHTRLTEKLDKATPNTAEHDEAINNVTQAQTNIDDHAASWHSRRNGGVSSESSFPDRASKDKDGNHTMVDIPGIGMMHRQQLDGILKSIKPHQAVALHNVTQNSDGTPNGATHTIFEPDGVTGKEGKGAVVTHFGIFPSTPSTNATETHANNGTMGNWKIMGRDMGNRLHHAIRTGNPHLEHYNDATMIHDIRGVLGPDHPLLQNPRIKKVLDKTKMATPPQRTASIPDTSQSTSPPRVTSPPITTGPSKTGIKAPIHAMNKFLGQQWAEAEGQNPRYASTDTISAQLKRSAFNIAAKIPGATNIPDIKEGALNALDYHIQSMTPDK